MKRTQSVRPADAARRRSAGGALALSTLIAVTAAACGGSGSSTNASAVTTPSFPVKVTATNGAVTIPARPHRILSLSASATQMLFAMGAGTQVVAVDKYSTYPANAPRTQLTGFETSAETYVPYHPDLVVLAQDSGGTVVAQLGLLRVPTLVLGPATTLADAYSQIAVLGQATGNTPAAGQEVAAMKSRIQAITASAGARGHGRTYYIEIDPTLYTDTSHTFAGALFSQLGMVNVADPADHTGSGYPQLNAEFLIAANPQVVVLADTTCCGQTAQSFAARPGFSSIEAVRNHRILAVDDSLASEWGPHTVESFYEQLAGFVNRG